MQPVMLNPIISTILVIFFILASLILLGLIAAVAFLVWKLNGVLERYQAKIEPILEKADTVLTLIGEKTDSIGGKAEFLLTQGEEMAENVHERVDRTAVVVQKTINAPIIQANSIAAALSRGWATFSRLQGKVAGNGQAYGIAGNGVIPAGENTELTLETGNIPLRTNSERGSATESTPDTNWKVGTVSSTVEEPATVVVGRSG